MVYPIADIESGPLGGEIAVIESQEVLIVVFETLDRVRYTLREVPNVADFEGLEDIAAFLIDGRDGNPTSVDVAPFSLPKCQLHTLQAMCRLQRTTRCQ